MTAVRVWLVTRGEYSDYSIQGVFSTQEKCLDYIANQGKAYPCADDLEVEEWPLDDGPVGRDDGSEWNYHDVTIGESGFAIKADQVMKNKSGVVYSPPPQPEAGAVRVSAFSAAEAVVRAEFKWRVARANSLRKVEGHAD